LFLLQGIFVDTDGSLLAQYLGGQPNGTLHAWNAMLRPDECTPVEGKLWDRLAAGSWLACCALLPLLVLASHTQGTLPPTPTF